MRTALIRFRSVLLVLSLLIVLGLLAAAFAWNRTSVASVTMGDVQTLLPVGSDVESFVRVTLEPHSPSAAAVLAAVPKAPGVHATSYQTFVLAYDRWRRHFRQVYSAPLPGPLPLSVDAGRLLGDRDAAIFMALNEDGTRSYRVVGAPRGQVTVLYTGRVAGRILVAIPLVIEEGQPPRALAWDGRQFRERPVPATLPPVYRGVTWHYGVRKGTVLARTFSVQLHPRQTLRVDGGRTGTNAIVIPDPRLDLVEAGYRARQPGTYTIRILIPILSADAYPLRVVVTDAPRTLSP